ASAICRVRPARRWTPGAIARKLTGGAPPGWRDGVGALALRFGPRRLHEGRAAQYQQGQRRPEAIHSMYHGCIFLLVPVFLLSAERETARWCVYDSGSLRPLAGNGFMRGDEGAACFLPSRHVKMGDRRKILARNFPHLYSVPQEHFALSRNS